MTQQEGANPNTVLRVFLHKTNNHMILKTKIAATVAFLTVLAGFSGSASATESALASPTGLHELVAQVAPDRLQADVATLVNFGTRHTLSETASEHRGIGAARRWIEARFNAISAGCGDCLEVFTLSDVVQGRRIPEPTESLRAPASHKSLRLFPMQPDFLWIPCSIRAI